ncbi:MAG: hypothetical protein JWO80_248 [Bryobacterales bacterium]|nr:hypothetical protein [Bryobacterales bacterium]
MLIFGSAERRADTHTNGHSVCGESGELKTRLCGRHRARKQFAGHPRSDPPSWSRPWMGDSRAISADPDYLRAARRDCDRWGTTGRRSAVLTGRRRRSSLCNFRARNHRSSHRRYAAGWKLYSGDTGTIGGLAADEQNRDPFESFIRPLHRRNRSPVSVPRIFRRSSLARRNACCTGPRVRREYEHLHRQNSSGRAAGGNSSRRSPFRIEGRASFWAAPCVHRISWTTDLVMGKRRPVSIPTILLAVILRLGSA